MRYQIVCLTVAVLVLVGAFAPSWGTSYAQEVSLTTPVSRTSETKYTVGRLDVTATQALIEIKVKDSANAEIRYFNVVVPSTPCGTATVAGIFTALDTVRAAETGGVLRRANFRLLGYLSDNGCGLPAHTLLP